MAARRNALVQRAAADVQSLPAPVGGWNARDSLANMEPTDAVVLENMFPTVSSVVLRGGYTKWATGMAGQVQTIMIYSGGNTTEVFAITSGGALYDVTVTGPVGAPILTGFLSGKWEYTNIATSGGNFLMAVNGADYALLYDGTSWSSITSVSAPIAITGVDTRDLHNIVLFKNRIWFIQKETLKAWYLPTSSVGGAAQQFSLQSVARDGGYLVDLDAWTIDAGYGVDDNLAFVTDSGEVIIYRGTDPASDATWALIGVWKLGAPVGERCMLKWGGDLLILTYDGLVPMAASLQSSRLDPRVSLSNKIQGAITAATTAYGSAPVGWEIVYNAKTNALWINVPVAVGSQQQYVMNTITKSWCNFTGWSANCWAIVNNDPYFGSDGYIGKAWDDTYADDNTNIATNTLQAFNYFGSRGVKKYFTRARASIFTDGIPEIFVGMNVDFDTANTTAPLAFIPSATGLWDIGYWDDAIWGAGNIITNTWLGITGIGYCGGLQMVTGSQQTQIEWASTDVVYQSGWAGV
jgi:hypothetical protein